jgi:GTP-binding protein
VKEACGRTPYLLSSAANQGVQEVLQALLSVIDEARTEGEAVAAQDEWRP